MCAVMLHVKNYRYLTLEKAKIRYASRKASPCHVSKSISKMLDRSRDLYRLAKTLGLEISSLDVPGSTGIYLTFYHQNTTSVT